MPILSLKNNTWGDPKEQSGGIAISAPCDWTNATIEFTANPLTDKTKCSYLSLGVSGDATYMFDDVTVIASVDNANVYGSVVYMLDTLGGPDLQPVSGDPGDPIELPTPTRAGYRFGGWYKESNLKEKRAASCTLTGYSVSSTKALRIFRPLSRLRVFQVPTPFTRMVQTDLIRRMYTADRLHCSARAMR